MHLSKVLPPLASGPALAADLARGIRSGELRLFLQGQVDAGGAVSAAEALVRWAHPEHGILAPAAFIPVAETFGLMGELEQWVLESSCSVLSRHQHPSRISVNISPRHLLGTDFVRTVSDSLNRHNLAPARLTLEITESLFERPVTEVVERLESLASLGISLSMDDFGTGYSSLAHLAKLPIHELKLDRSLVRDAPSRERDAIVCNAVIELCNKLRLRIVAEGIETIEQAKFFGGACELLQGFLFGRPEPVDQWIAKFRPGMNAGRKETLLVA